MEEHFVLSHSMIRILFNKQRRGNRDHGKTVCGTWFNYLLTGPLRTNRHSFRLKPPFLRSILRPAPELTWATCVLRVLYNLVIKISLKCYRSWDSSFSIHDNHWPLIEEEGILFRTLRNTLTSCALSITIDGTCMRLGRSQDANNLRPLPQSRGRWPCLYVNALVSRQSLEEPDVGVCSVASRPENSL